jgi:ribosomal protein S18
MEFNYKQFLTKNKLTNQSKVKSLFENKINEEVDDDEVLDEPNIKDIKPSKSTDNLAKKQYQLATLIKRKDELVSKFKSNEISIDQYKEMIGNTPQHIKTLTADIEKLEGGELNEVTLVTPEALERMDGIINRRDLELFKNSLENITNELEQEGFELSDIKAYIQRELDEILGIYNKIII